MEKSFLIWNEFIHVLALHDYTELSPEQRPAQLVFWYESEVQNGGHLQYFENKRCVYLEETVSALGQLGALQQQQILRDASTLFLSRPRKTIQTVEEYVTTELEEEFGEYDERFHACSPSLNDCLERHLREHRATFVTIV